VDRPPGAAVRNDVISVRDQPVAPARVAVSVPQS
jgi:hypothetical protein